MRCPDSERHGIKLNSAWLKMNKTEAAHVLMSIKKGAVFMDDMRYNLNGEN